MAGARSRTLNFVLAADAKQVQRAFTQAEKASDRYAKDTEHAPRGASQSFASIGEVGAEGAAGSPPPTCRSARRARAIHATEDLGKATAGLHRNLGLTIEQASRWGGVAKARGIDNKALTMSFTTCRAGRGGQLGRHKQVKLFKTLGISQAI
jgi:hypothetical protein